MDNLYSILQNELRHAADQSTPLHMPGHKRRVAPCPELPYSWDTTEVPATDDLHDAHGILAEAMARTAALWGAGRSWYLVNGSTVGLLAGIRALTQGKAPCLIAARNCHKAVYHAIELCGLAVRWLAPPVDEGFGVYGSITPAMVAAALEKQPDAACVVLTSPTYEGVLSDIAGIAAVCHAHGVPLLVDEAHGAHYLPLARRHGWQGGAVAAGADVVVQSAHKTLPSLTQTALLHLNGEMVPAAALERQLDVFETSSPSYPLMVSLDACTGWLAAEGNSAFAVWRERLSAFDRSVAGLQTIRVLCHNTAHPSFFGYDSGKILMDIGPAGAAFLRERGLEPEMVCGQNVLAMTSPCDASDTLERLAAALRAYDRVHKPELSAACPLPAPGQSRCTIAEALTLPAFDLPAGEAEGKVAAEYVWAYPPGVPLLAPGESVTKDFLAAHAALQTAGTALHHSAAAPGCLHVLA